ncbi:hypothetical protein STSO111631_14635 [Stackebrandtia soli]
MIIGTAVSDVVNIVIPRTVVFGGQLAEHDDLIPGFAREVSHRRTFPLATTKPVIMATALVNAGVHRLAHLIADHVFAEERIDASLAKLRLGLAAPPLPSRCQFPLRSRHNVRVRRSASMQSNNPALNRMLATTAQQHQMAPEYGHYGQQAAPPQVRPMTLDDVVVRTVGLLVLTGLSGAFSWWLADVNPGLTSVLMMVGMVAGVGVAIASWFMMITNPYVIGAYAIGQGLLLGVISKLMEASYAGIVLQAILGTFGVFVGMALLYKARVVRNSPKFTKFMIGAGFGIMALLLVNIVGRMFNVDLGLFNNGDGNVTLLQWGIAIFFVGWAALSFILDFDMVEQGVRYGAPQKMAWAAAFGMTAGLIFLYWSILRLLSYLRQ